MLKKVLINTAKVGLVGILLYWLATTGRLEFSELRILLDKPYIFCAAIGLWLFGSLIIGSLRWNLLLRGLGIQMPLLRAMRLQLIGFFFNTAMPGAVGGDVIKGMYVLKEKTATSKTNALLTIIIDRIIGLVAVFAVAAVAIVYRFDFVRGNAGLMTLSLLIAVGVVVIFIVAIFCLTEIFSERDPFLFILSKKFPGFGIARKIYAALILFRKDPGTIGKAFLLSIAAQFSSLLYGYLLATSLSDKAVDIMIYAVIHPIGILTTALPLAPGGLGIGHIAFEKLFVMAKIDGGANVFNVMVLSQLALNLFGIIPYMLHKSEIGGLENASKEIDRVVESGD
jgi:uncharacterized protein (TIRG00374 family)